MLVHGALWCTDYTALGCLDENYDYGVMMCDFSKGYLLEGQAFAALTVAK